MKITFKNREEWLNHKKDGFKLSSSNIGIILGLSEYITPYQYWLNYHCGTDTQNTNTIRGNIFEDSIAKYFEELSTEKVVKNTADFYVLKKEGLPDYIEVSPDRELFKNGRKTRLFLEIKDTKRYIDLQKDDDIPGEWFAQIQMQMYVGNYEGCVLCVYNGNKEISYRYFSLDKDFAKEMINKAIEWVEKYIFGNEEPEAESMEDVQIKYPLPKENTYCDVEDSFRTVIEEYNKLNAQKKEIEKQIEGLKNKISLRLGENEILKIGGIECASFKYQNRICFDIDKFRGDRPDIYDEYLINKGFRTLRVKKIKI